MDLGVMPIQTRIVSSSPGADESKPYLNLKSPKIMFASFQTYALHPQYVLPLSDAPATPTARLFFRELPLALGIVVVSIATFLARNYLTDQDGLQIFSTDRHYPVLTVVMTILFLILLIELLFRAVLRLTPSRVSGFIWGGLFVLASTLMEPGKQAMGKDFFLWAMGAWLVTSFLLGRFLKRPTVFARLEQVWQAQFRWIFYGSALL